MNELSGCTILYTRDAAHYPAFRERIAALDGRVLHLPLMATRVQPLTATDRTILDHSDILVFTSAAAVRHLLEQYPLRGQQTVAIGEITAAALPQPSNITAPAPYNSEALLAHWQPRAGASPSLLLAVGGNTSPKHSAKTTQYTASTPTRATIRRAIGRQYCRCPMSLPLPASKPSITFLQ